MTATETSKTDALIQMGEEMNRIERESLGYVHGQRRHVTKGTEGVREVAPYTSPIDKLDRAMRGLFADWRRLCSAEGRLLGARLALPSDKRRMKGERDAIETAREVIIASRDEASEKLSAAGAITAWDKGGSEDKLLLVGFIVADAEKVTGIKAGE